MGNKIQKTKLHLFRGIAFLSRYNRPNQQTSVGAARLPSVPNFEIMQFIFIQHTKQEIALQIYE